MISRRNLLQYFGIGTAIVPVIGGVPRLETPAALVQVPSIEPVAAPLPAEILDPSMLVAEHSYEKVTIDVFVRTSRQTYHFGADTFLTRGEAHLIDVTTFEDKQRRFIEGGAIASWVLEGTVCAPPRVGVKKR